MENEFFPVVHVRSLLRIWSRETDSAVPSRVSLLVFILRLNLVLTKLTGFLPISAAASVYQVDTLKIPMSVRRVWFERL